MTSKPRRDKGSGSLVETSPGVWRLRVFLGKDLVTGKPRQLERIHRGRQTTAARRLRELQQEVADGKHLAADPTVAYLLDQWMEQRRRTRRPTTLYTSESTIEKHLKPKLGHLKVGKITAWDLDQHYTAMRTAGLGEGTIRLHHNLMSGALRQAVRWGWLDKSPAPDANPPRQQPTSKRAPSTDEVRRLVQLAEAEGDFELATTVSLAALTGARRGELCGLQWGDIDWERKVVTFRRTRVPVEGGDVTGQLKSGTERPVALDDVAVFILKRYLQMTVDRARQLGIDRIANGWLLSYDCGRTPIVSKKMSAEVSALGTRAKIPITLHELRHYSATQLVAAGVDVRTAAARLGHAPEVLLRVYAHALPDQDRAAATGLGAGLRGPVVNIPSPSISKEHTE